MRNRYSVRLLEDINCRVRATLQSRITVNITAVAEEVRLRNLAENIALEDIECLVMQAAQLLGAAIEFDRFAQADLTIAPYPQLMQCSATIAHETPAETAVAIPPDPRG